APDDLVRRRLVDAPLGVDTRVDAGDVPAGRYEARSAARRIVDLKPRKVDRGVVRVAGQEVLGLRRIDEIRVERAGGFGDLRRVEDREPVLQAGAVIDDALLGRLRRNPGSGDDCYLVD